MPSSEPRQSGSRPQRQFVQTSRAWYSATALDRGTVDEVRIGVDWVEPDNGCEYEFLIVWIELQGQAVPKLTMFDDSWKAIREMADVMAWIADHHEVGVTPEEVCEALLGMGFTDATKETRDER